MIHRSPMRAYDPSLGSRAALRHRSTGIGVAALLLLTLAVLFPRLPAQCATEWASYGGVPGLDNVVNASATWDPDGAGPAQPVLVLGGRFSTAGNAVTQSIAMYDLQTRTFSGMGGPGLTNGAYTEVQALVTLPNGDLIAGGDFTLAGSTAVANIARWDGTSWHPLGLGISGRVHALAVMPNGDLIAGGTFVMAGTTATNFIARWDGTTWLPLGTGGNGSVTALCALPNGDVIAGGLFTMAGGMPAQNVARWNGTSWSPLGSGLTTLSPDAVRALVVMPNGDLIAGGGFYYAGSTIVSRLARWDGNTWTGFGMGVAGSAVYALLVLPNGDLLVGGNFGAIDGVSVNGLGRWDGTAWSAFGGFASSTAVSTLAPLPGGGLFAGGGTFIAGGPPAWHGALWDGSAWRPLAAGTDGTFYALAARANGGVIAGGGFSMVAGVSANNIAVYDGTTWSPLGTGTDGVLAVAEMPNGDVIAGGGFSMAGGVAASRIARWDGTAWHPLGAGVAGLGTSNPSVWSCLVHSSGDLIVSGRFLTAGMVTANNIARWDGTAWHALGSGVGNFGANVVYHLAELPNGDIIAGGMFFTAGGVSINGGLARWDGTSWHPFGTGLGLSGPSALIVRRNGHVVFGGQAWVGEWDGTAWQTLGSPPNGEVKALAELPNGDLIAGGNFNMSGSVVTRSIARWDGTSWSPIGAILGAWVEELELLKGGILEVGGSFTIAGGLAAASLAEWRTTCPALAVSIPAGCVGSSGSVSLAATALPWTGSSFASEATGLAPNGLAAVLVGFTSPSQPLALWTPLAGPGCLLNASSEAISLVVPQAGTATWSILIPNDPSYAGLTLFHQYLQIDVAGSQPLLTNSNTLRLVLGTF